MSKRAFLAGFGAGMAVSAGLMLAAGFAENPAETKAVSAPPATPARSEETVAQAVPNDARKPTPPVPPVPAKPPEPVEPAQAGQPGQPAPPKPVNPTATSPPSATQAPAPPREWVTFTVPSGASSTQVAKTLVDAGVLSAPEPFLSMLRKEGKLNRIRVGTYRAQKGTDPADAIRLLTTPPKR